jgi:hypothetical protein
MDKDDRINEVVEEILKSDSFDELLADEEVSLSISNFIKWLIQQPNADKYTFDQYIAFKIDLWHIKEHLRNAAMPQAVSIVEDEILHPNRED